MLLTALLLACAHHPPSSSGDPSQPIPGPALQEFQAWCSDVRARVYANLADTPEAQANPAAEVWVDLVVDEDGAISDPKVSRSSGFPAIDEAVLAAVRASDPLPRPPKADREILAAGVTFKVKARPAK
jgi:TonB family protein